MSEGKLASVAFSLFKAAVFLAVGSMIGFFLGLAYACHLYGPSPVVTEIQNWLAGDSLYEGPLPIDQAGNLMNTPVAIIPKLGACFGFGIAASVLSGSIFLKVLLSSIRKADSSSESANKSV